MKFKCKMGIHDWGPYGEGRIIDIYTGYFVNNSDLPSRRERRQDAKCQDCSAVKTRRSRA